MSEPKLSPEHEQAAQAVLDIMAAAPVPLSVHQAGQKALGVLLRDLLPKAPAEAPPEAPKTGPELVK